MSLIINPRFPVVAARKDAAGNWSPVDLTEEWTVRGGIVRLAEVPMLPPTGIGGVIVEGMTEVLSTPSSPNTYKVNYETGRLLFHTSNEDYNVTCKYKGRGTLIATDEINYLWSRSEGSHSFVGLDDTPDTFIPNAYVRTNAAGTALINDIPTLGRAASKTLVHDFTEALVLPGTLFDVISVYESTASAPKTESVVMSWSGGGSEAAGKWQSGANSTTIIGPMKTATLSKLAAIDVAAIRGSGLRFCVSIDGVFYKVDDNRFRQISTTQPPSILAIGNDVTEIANIADRHIRDFPGADIYFVFEGSNASIDLTWSITGEFDGGWAQVRPAILEFDSVMMRWKIATSAQKKHLVIIGSGRDELAFTSDVITFTAVKKGDELAVRAPVQTIATVAYSTGDVFVPAIPGIDASIIYNDSSKSWVVTSKVLEQTTFRIAIAGNAWKTQVQPVRFSDLVDGTSLHEQSPKALVAKDGAVEKMTFIHPYLL